MTSNEAWKKFQKTGRIDYYIKYKDLQRKGV